MSRGSGGVLGFVFYCLRFVLIPACTEFAGCFADVGFITTGTRDLIHYPCFVISLLFVFGADEDLSEVSVRLHRGINSMAAENSLNMFRNSLDIG